MELSPVPVRPAPGFTLTDQDGRVRPLSAFRGKVVVLEFIDPHCTDICSIVSAEFTDAYRDLGRQGGQVVFAAVNVNQYHHAVADVAAYSRAHQLTSIPSWHFFTGPVPRLRAVWNAYNIAVQAPGPDADIVHSSVVYFIDPGGRERYLASARGYRRSRGTSGHGEPGQSVMHGRILRQAHEQLPLLTSYSKYCYQQDASGVGPSFREAPRAR